MATRTVLDLSSSPLPSTQQREEAAATVPLSVCQNALRGNVEINSGRPLVNVTNLPSESATETRFDHFNQNKQTLILPNGDKYEGVVLDNLPHGFGTLICNNGTVYVGQFQKGEYSGIGTLKLANGDRFKGEFEHGLFNGFGTYQYSNKDVYQGFFASGMRTNGTLTYANGSSYEGDYRSNLRQGYGTLTTAEGDVYQGQFKNGLMHGIGTIKFADGRPPLKGQFANDEFLRQEI